MRLLLLWILNAVALLAVRGCCRDPGVGLRLTLAAARCRHRQRAGAAGAGAPHLPITVLTLGIFYLVLNGLCSGSPVHS
jgi:putative membrane protein